MKRRLDPAHAAIVAVLFAGFAGGACAIEGGEKDASSIEDAMHRGHCAPKTCSQLGATCGILSDRCGGNVSCGTCAAPLSCGGGGTPNVCGPSPQDSGPPPEDSGAPPQGADASAPGCAASGLLSGNCGIAAKYPGDKNIASDTDVLFADDFEGYTSASQLWGNYDNVYQQQYVQLATGGGNIASSRTASRGQCTTDRGSRVGTRDREWRTTGRISLWRSSRAR
jgi:hypothetical protein